MSMKEACAAAMDALAAIVPKPPADGVIGQDGLLYCPVCQKPLQVKIRRFPDEPERIVPCVCKCVADELERQQREKEHREFLQRVSKLRSAGFPDSDFETWNFEADDGSNPKLQTALRSYVDNFDTFSQKGKGLLLWGSVGTGKTFAAACIANALIDKGVPVLMTNFHRIANTLQGKFDGRQDYIDGLNDFPLLIIDDLKTERQTEYMQEIVYNIIDSRYRSGKPFIITTNLTLQEVKTPKNISDGRSFDRILERCFPVEVNGASKRRKKIIADYEETKKMLGL